MKKGHDLKIREKLSKSYMQVIFIASISAIVGIGALLIMTRMYNHALTNYGFSQGDIGKAMTVFTGAQSDLRGAIGYDEESIIKELKEDYYVKQDSFNTYLAEVEKSMVTKAGRDAYNQILSDLDGYWNLSDELIEIGATTDEAGSKEAQNRANKELKPLYEVVYNDLKNLMDINIQKGDQLEAILAVMEIIVVIVMIAVIILSILIGEGGSGGALALAVADEVWMMENAVYSILSPEGFSSILWKDSKRAKEAADSMKLTAADLKKAGIVERVFEEPAHFSKDHMEDVAEALRSQIDQFLLKYGSMDSTELCEHRYQRFRKY